MGRFAFALTSFTAAIPAGILSAILVMAFMSQLEGIRQSTVMLIMVGLTLGLSSFVLLIPFGILVFGGPKKAKPTVDKAAKKKVEEQPAAGPESATGLAAEDSAAEVLESSAAEAGDSDSMEIEMMDSSGEIDAEELEETSAFATPLSSPDLDADAVVEDDLDDMIEIEEIKDEVVLEDDEETKPKKRRR